MKLNRKCFAAKTFFLSQHHWIITLLFLQNFLFPFVNTLLRVITSLWRENDDWKLDLSPDVEVRSSNE